GNVTVSGGMIVQTPQNVAELGLNGMTYVAGTGYSGTPGNQTITVTPGGSFLMLEGGYGASATTQNFVISGTGTSTRSYLGSGKTIADAAGVDAALQLLNVNSSDHVVYGGLAVAADATVRVNAAGRFNLDDQNNNQVVNSGIPGL